MHRKLRWLVPVTAVVLSTACATATESTPGEQASPPPASSLPRPWLNAAPFGERPGMLAPAALYRLTAPQRRAFLEYFHAERNRDTAPNQRIADYLESRLDNFNYYAKTVTAQAAVRGQQGNCLSLALLTRSLADIAGVDLKFELVESRPVYHKQDNVVVTSRHVRSKLLNPPPEEKHSKILARGGVFIDYFRERGSRPLRDVDPAELTSMYYQNQASEALIAEHYDRAYWLLRRALALSSDSPSAINMMALTYFHAGEHDTAEALYHYGLDRANDKVRLLSNYHLLLKEQGRTEEAEAIVARIDRLDRGNPFRWISVANDAYNRGYYSTALVYYEKAKHIAPYLPDIYAAIARAHHQMGHLHAARQALQHAAAKARRDDSRQRYLAKMQALSGELAQ